MKEFLVLIRNEGNPVAQLSPEQQQAHIQKVGAYIQEQMEKGRMKAAQPLEMEGKILSIKNGSFIDGPFNETKEVISGYYQILAVDLEDALEITKADPRFEDGKWRMEIRPIMVVEGIN